MGENVIKITGKIGASQTFYVTGDGDYDTLKNIPIINLTGTDEEPILLNTLETGLYRLNGVYKANASEIDKTQVENRLTIVKKVSDNAIYLQMLNPQENIVEFYHITEADTLYREIALNNLATVQDIPTKVSELENDSKYITEEELKTFGYATEAFVRSQGYLTEETDPTVPDHVKNITEEDINNWNKEYQLPVASQTTLGGVKVGNNLSIDQDGTLNAEKGTQSYAELTNKPKINDVELDGEKSLDDLGIQAQGDYALKNEIPTKTSELNNDSGFLTSIPDDYKTKEENDELYQAKGDYATKDELPTKTSQLENDSNFITEIPTASADVLGGIKVGNNLEITPEGALNALGGIPKFVGTQENPITLTSTNIVEEPICLLSGYIKDSPVYNNRDIRDTLILYNLTDKDAIGSRNRKTQVIYLGYGSLASNFTGLAIYTRNILLNTSTDLWNVYNNWSESYCNYQDSDYYKKAQSGFRLFNQSGASNMYSELMSYLTNNINNKPSLSGLTTTDKTSLVNAINEINAKIPSATSETANGTFVINLTEDASNGTYTADKNYNEINQAYENSLYIVVCLNNCLLPLLNAEKATDGNLGITFGYTNIQSGGNLITTRAIHYLYTGGEEKWEEADVNKEFLPITGGTMQGVLNLYAEPTEDIQASNKSYVDKKIFNITFTKEETAGLIADKEISDVIDAISRKVLITGTLENKIYYFNYYINGEVRLVNCDNNVISTISYSNDAWNLSTVSLLDTKGNTKLAGNLDVNNNQLKNVQKIHIDGEAPLYLGSTVETTGTKGTRLTGTTEGGVAFIKADSQGTYVPVLVGEPTANSHSATKKYVDEKLGNAQTELSTIYFANSTGDNNTWIEKDKLQPLLQEAYDKGYHDIIIRTTQGTKYIMCSGSDLQNIDGSSLQFVSLVHPTGSSTKPNRMFIGYYYANTIKVVDGVVTIEGTTGKSPVSYVDLMKENAFTEMQGYDSTKTQVLKNINGVLTWQNE